MAGLLSAGIRTWTRQQSVRFYQSPRLAGVRYPYKRKLSKPALSRHARIRDDWEVGACTARRIPWAAGAGGTSPRASARFNPADFARHTVIGALVTEGVAEPSARCRRQGATSPTDSRRQLNALAEPGKSRSDRPDGVPAVAGGPPTQRPAAHENAASKRGTKAAIPVPPADATGVANKVPRTTHHRTKNREHPNQERRTPKRQETANVRTRNRRTSNPGTNLNTNRAQENEEV
jgi:hypothetical protein